MVFEADSPDFTTVPRCSTIGELVPVSWTHGEGCIMILEVCHGQTASRVHTSVQAGGGAAVQRERQGWWLM